MPTLREELRDLQGDVVDLRELATQNLELDHSVFDRLDSVSSQVAEAVDSATASAELVAHLRRDLGSIQHDLAKAVALTGVMHYKSQTAIAKSIKDAAGDYVAGQAVGGVFKMLAAGVLGVAVAAAGGRIADAIESDSASKKKSTGAKEPRIRRAMESLISTGESGIFEIDDNLTAHLRPDGSFLLVRAQGRNALWVHYPSINDLHLPIRWNTSALDEFDPESLP